MIVVGITGGSGCGKSTVSEIFKNEGAQILDGDIISRKITEPGSDALKEIAQKFGDEFLSKTGELERRKLGACVFADPKKLNLLNEITHKYIAKYIDNYIEHSTAPICVIDAAALIESGIYKKCDYLICVIADKKTRIKRIMQRDGIDKEDAIKRISAQKNDDFYIEKSDYVLYNNDEQISGLRSEVNKIIDSIRSKF